MTWLIQKYKHEAQSSESSRHEWHECHEWHDSRDMGLDASRPPGSALREMEDREERRAKMTELSNEFDRKAREQHREVLSREQMMRLYQIRMQIRPTVESLANRRVAGRLQLTEEQQQKLAQISKGVETKQSELRGGMRGATEEQRRENFQKLRKIRSDADEEALAMLTTEQKEAFEKMKGEKLELPMQRGQQ